MKIIEKRLENAGAGELISSLHLNIAVNSILSILINDANDPEEGCAICGLMEQISVIVGNELIKLANDENNPIAVKIINAHNGTDDKGKNKMPTNTRH